MSLTRSTVAENSENKLSTLSQLSKPLVSVAVVPLFEEKWHAMTDTE